ncbi:hypothetical protein DYB26_007432 [Aphanomyces astaci]|uniref:Uncharacterized protein n=1 Tax=Aphanomyces astaci TaxID=112090 RepID=A0A397CUJ2_APHAT|nr:hypothetical protein DYB38_009819 [Aphanomyces astaci]RHY69918.1 hypothetical protein DYB34_010546 [Aphanomyces astaci]RHZ28447.1 hypothetical protein DYB26_007432 [Aphanomyces astaci]
MPMPVPIGVYGRAMVSQKPFMPERPKKRAPPEYIPQDSYGMRGHSNQNTPYFTPAHGDQGGAFGGGFSNPPGPSSYPTPGGHNPFERTGGRGDPPGPPGGGGPGGGGDDHGVEVHPGFRTRPGTVIIAIPLEHFLKKFDASQMEYGITGAQLVGIFDDRLNESGIPRFADRWARRVRDHAKQSWAESREAFRQEFIMKMMTERIATIAADS